jgi:hypothetical protein
MARYSNFLRHKVEVLYRAGEVVLPASGTFVADSGRSIFLEQHFEQRGQSRHFRWEIPYQYLVKLQDAAQEAAQERGAVNHPAGKNAIATQAAQDDNTKSRTHAASAFGGGASFLNPAHPPKTV